MAKMHQRILIEVYPMGDRVPASREMPQVEFTDVKQKPVYSGFIYGMSIDDAFTDEGKAFFAAWRERRGYPMDKYMIAIGKVQHDLPARTIPHVYRELRRSAEFV